MQQSLNQFPSYHSSENNNNNNNNEDEFLSAKSYEDNE